MFSKEEYKNIVDRFNTYLLTERCVSANTFSAYKRDIEQCVTFLCTHNVAYNAISVQNIKTFLHYLKKINCSARTMSRKISSLKVFFSYLHQRFGLQNVAEDLVFPKLEKRLPQYLSEEEVEKLFEVAGRATSPIGLRNKIMLYLLYVSGTRISELTKLQLSDIHFDTGLIFVHGKGGKGRMVPIPEQMLEMLKEYINTVHRSFVSKRGILRKTEYLFPIYYAGKSKAISRQAFWIILRQLWEKTDIKRPISPHKLRHSFATHMLKNGADLRSMQLLLGHENLSTVQIYTHVETSYIRKIYDKKHPRS